MTANGKTKEAYGPLKRRLAVTSAALSSMFSLYAGQQVLVVDAEGSSITGATAEYGGITLRGDWTIGAGASVTNLMSPAGTLLDIGPEEGDDVTMTVADGGQFVGSGTGGMSNDVIVVGRNGGKGTIVVSDVGNPPGNRNRHGWNYNDYTFGAMQWWLVLGENARVPDGSGTMDIVRIDTNAYFSVGYVSNANTQVKARILFNGGTYYMHHKMKQLFHPAPDCEIILEGTNGNPVKIVRMSGAVQYLVYHAGTSGYLRFAGDNDVVLHGVDNEKDKLRPGFNLSEMCRFEQTGDLVMEGNMLLRVATADPCLPFGPGKGSVVLRDPMTEFDTGGNTVPVNALLGCGCVSNRSATVTGTLVTSNTTDVLASATVSPDLQWCDSAMGVVWVKKGSGMLLADSMTSVPSAVIEAGGVRTTAAATPETMKWRTVTFKPWTVLDVAAGTYTAENTVLHPWVSVSIASGAAYRAQSGDSALFSPSVAAGGVVEKTGEGTLTVFDADGPFAGTVRAQSGSVVFSGHGDTNSFWRLTFIQSNASNSEDARHIIEFADINLYDAEGGKVVTSQNKMKQAEFGIDASLLQPGEITLPAGTVFETSHEVVTTLKYLFDYGRWSNYTFPDAVARPDDESSWFPITFRLPEGHAPVAVVKLVRGWGSNLNTPQAWRLESSPDGVNWVTRSERMGGEVLKHASDGVFSDDATIGYQDARESVGLAPTAVLRADAGATIDLGNVPAGSAPCAGIEFDYAKGGGTITRFEPAADGVLTITNYPEDAGIGGFELPLVFEATGDVSVLATWKLFVNGVERTNRIGFAGGRICVRHKGMSVIFR